MPDPKHQSITSSTYSGNSSSIGTATEQNVKRIEAESMTRSTEEAQRRRRENRKKAEARRKEEAKQK
jgi:hypothetical protein